ncbi:MAG: DUF488 family protein [Ktedonobacteraceae bacterium]
MTGQYITVALKRVYDEPASSDGTRVLVERLGSRGLAKDRAHLALWLKEVAPCHERRTRFGHDPEKFVEFRRCYEGELVSGAGQEVLNKLRTLAKQGPITLVFAAHDAEHTNAVVLHALLSRNDLSRRNKQEDTSRQKVERN